MVTYVLNFFNSKICCLEIRQLQMIFTSHIMLDISLSKNFFMNVGFRLLFVLKIETADFADEWSHIFPLVFLSLIHCFCIPSVVFCQKHDLVLH